MDRSNRRARWVVLAGTLAAHALYAALGIRFNASTLGSYMQFVDPELLRTDLWRSIHYLRDQPPLFNLVVGLVLKACGRFWGEAFNVLYFGAALALAATLFSLLVRMRVANGLAAAVTLAFVNGPVAILYENFLFYTYPVALLVCLSLYFLHAWLAERRARHAAALFAVLALLVLTRGVFHPAWLLGTAGALVALEVGRRRVLALAALGPLVVVAAWMVKHYLVFDTLLAGKVYQQINLAVMTTLRLPDAERRQLVSEGRLSPIANLEMRNSLRVYFPYVKLPPPTGIPVLDRQTKSTGHVNFNHFAYVPIAALYGRDAAVTMRLHPALYRRSVTENVARYMLPSDQANPFFLDRDDNGVALRGVARVYDLALAGQAQFMGTPWGHWIGIPALLAWAVIGAWRTLRRDGWRARASPTRATALVQLFGAATVLYLSLVTMLVSFGDHNRYRFEVAPVFWVLAALALQAARDAVRRHRARSAAIA